jgi:hypothetical protein
VATKYHLDDPATVDLDDGRVVAKFAAGDRTPKDDVEAEALAHLVAIGVASVVSSKGD